MSAQTKRMQLSRDQRAVLEAVYAIEKLPDASLRERLGSYLSLTTRQIQVSASTPRPLGNGRGGTVVLADRRPTDLALRTRVGLGTSVQGYESQGAAVLGLTLTGRTRNPSTSPSP